MDPGSFLAALFLVQLGAAPVQRLYRRAQPVIAGGTGLLMAGFGAALIFAL